jgi:hypothetical protein
MYLAGKNVEVRNGVVLFLAEKRKEGLSLDLNLEEDLFLEERNIRDAVEVNINVVIK